MGDGYGRKKGMTSLRSRGRSLLPRRRTDRDVLLDRATILLAAAIFGVTFYLRDSLSTTVNANELLPITLLAVRFGLRGGIAGAIVSLALVFTCELLHPMADLTALGYATRVIAFLMTGLLLGSFLDHRHRLEAELMHYFEDSLDLLATADRNGGFVRVNPAWEATLGRSAAELCSRPLVSFTHPEDRVAAAAQLSALLHEPGEHESLRSRFETADGGSVWIEWNGHMSQRHGLLHVSARDVTSQVHAEQQIRSGAKLLQAKVAERTRELDEERADTLRRLVRVGEYRNDATFQRAERVAATAGDIAAALGLDPAEVRLIREAAPLHDIGNLAIPDEILLKPGPLNDRERGVMRSHTTAGARLLGGSRSPALALAALGAASHHEHWDGRGYPDALAGEAIPLVGRIVGVANAYDALTHDRPYSEAWPVERAIAQLEREAGTRFDPRVVAAFLASRRPTDPSPVREDAELRERQQRVRRPAAF